MDKDMFSVRNILKFVVLFGAIGLFVLPVPLNLVSLLVGIFACLYYFQTSPKDIRNYAGTNTPEGKLLAVNSFKPEFCTYLFLVSIVGVILAFFGLAYWLLGKESSGLQMFAIMILFFGPIVLLSYPCSSLRAWLVSKNLGIK